MASIQHITPLTTYLANLKAERSNLYLSIGKITEWNAYDTPPNDTDLSPYQILQAKNDTVSIFKVNPDNCTQAFRTIHWVSGMNIDKYDSHKSVSEYTYPYYVLVDFADVYLCVDTPLNNTAVSTQKPLDSQGIFETSDGFSWVKLYTVPSNLRHRISTYIPLVPEGLIQDVNIQSYGISSFNSKVVSGNDMYHTPIIEMFNSGYNGLFSVRTQHSGTKSLLSDISVVNTGINYKISSYGILRDSINTGNGAQLRPIIENGVITNVQILNSGALYDSAICMIVGDGTGAQIDLTISSGVITGVHIITGGVNYTSHGTQLFVVAGTSARYLKPSLIPYGGFIANVESILQANVILVYVQMPTLNLEYLPSGLRYRQIGLFENVKMGNAFATGEAYATIGNPYYNSVPYNKISLDAVKLVYLNSRSAFIHDAHQQEEILIPLKF